MEIRTCLIILLKRLWIITLIPVLAAAVTGVVSRYELKPAYESSMTFFVMNRDSNSQAKLAYDDILASQQLIKDCRELIKSKSVTKAVIEQLGLENLTAEELAGKITVSLKNDTRIFEIKVRDADKIRVKMITDTLGGIIQNKVKELMKLETFEVVDEADPGRYVSPRPLVNSTVAFFAALFLMLAAVFLKEYLDDTIKNAEDVEKYLGIKVIAAVPSLDLK